MPLVHKIVGVSGCTAMVQVSETKCCCPGPGSIYHMLCLNTALIQLVPAPASCMNECLGKLGAVETYEASPRTASHTPYLSRGEGVWESIMALDFIGCEEHERFILGVLCSLCEHFYFFTVALPPNFEAFCQGRVPSRCALRGCDWIHCKLPSQDLL